MDKVSIKRELNGRFSVGHKYHSGAGFKKGYVPWNKGKKIANSLIGHVCYQSKERSQKISYD